MSSTEPSESSVLLAHFVTLLERTTDFVYFKDEASRFLFCSQTLADITGHASWRDMRGKHDREVFPPDTAAIYEAEERGIFERGEPLLGRVDPYYTADGERRWVQTNKWPVFADDGQRVVGLFGISRDVTEQQQTVARLRRSRQRLALAGRLSWDAVYEWWCDEGRMDWFGPVDELFGLAEGGLGPSLQDFMERVHPDDRPRVDSVLAQRATSHEPFDLEYRVRHAGGGWRVWSDRALPVRGDDGAFSHFLGVCRDITELRAAEQQRNIADDVFRVAAEGVLVADAAGDIVSVNPTLLTFTGRAAEDLVGRSVATVFGDQRGKRFVERLFDALSRRDQWQGEVKLRDPGATARTLQLSASTVRDSQGQVLRYVGLFADISAQKAHEQQLEHVAHHDPITGLPNRTLLADRLRQAMARADRSGLVVAVAYVDLDGFKAINDRHGHDVGDGFLLQVAERLRAVCRAQDTVARIGGDEFVLVLEDLPDRQAAVPLCERVLAALRAPASGPGEPLRASASLGLTFHPQSTPLAEDGLLRQADQAMYRAKNAGKNRMAVFADGDMGDALARHQAQLQEFRAAIADGQLQLHYQPQVRLASARVDGVEALVRWQHPTRGLLSPAAFLALADAEPARRELGDWVLGRAAADAARFQGAGLKLRVSVNVHPMDLQQADFPARLAGALAAQPSLRPLSLRLEVVESAALQDLDATRDIMEACARLGVDFSLDDFGTGYASLTWLKQLPVRELKVDRSFVRDMADDPGDLAILQAVLAMAHSLRLEVVAEGVETAEQGTFLLRLGCRFAQGYAIARPLPSDEVVDWVRSWRPPLPWTTPRPLPEEHRVLVAFGVDLRSWRNALHELRGQAEGAMRLGGRTCRLHDWLQEAGPSALAGVPEFDELVALHRELHDAAESLPPTSEGRDEVAGEQARRMERLLELLEPLLQRVSTA